MVGSALALLADADEGLVMGFLVADEGAVRLDYDGVRGAVLDDFALLAPGVELGVGS